MASGTDVIGSRPDGDGGPGRLARAVRRARQAVARRLPPGSAARNRLGILLALPLAAGGLVLLRSDAEPVVGSDRALPGTDRATTGGPVPEWSEPGPPYGPQSGRSPIPPPTHAGWYVRGSLPAVGGPDRPGADRSVQLVLGRFCRRPDRYTLTFDPQHGWRQVSVLAFHLDRSGAGPAVALQLTWTGRSYDWTGTAVQLSAC